MALISSREHAKILDLIGEGEIQGLVNGLKSVYLDDVAIQAEDGEYNIEGVEVTLRKGTTQQPYIEGFTSASSVESVGQEVTKEYIKEGETQPEIPNNPVEVTIYEPNTDSIIITLEFQGLYIQGVNDYNKGEVRFIIEYKKYGEDYQPVPYLNYNNIPYFYQTYKNLQTQAAIGEETTLTGYTESNYGVELVVNWNRSLKEQVYEANTLINIYNGTYARVNLYHKKHDDIDWVDAGIYEINIKEGYDLFGRYLIVSEDYSSIISIPVYFEFEEEDEYQYKAEFIASNDSESKIFLLPSASYTSGSMPIYLNARSMSPFKQDYKFPLNCTEEEFPVDIRVTRITDEDDQRMEEEFNEDNDGNGRAVESSFSVYSITKLIDQKFTYPNTALIALSFDAQSYDKIPKRSYELYLLKVKVPVNYDPITREYDGFWNGDFKTAWTDNPAWCLYDLMINERYGIGKYLIDDTISDPSGKFPTIDKWGLYRIAQFCDELVPSAYGVRGKEPRFTCNTYFASQEEAFILLRNLASIFRGMLYWMDNKITAVYDHPVDTVDIMFSNSNIIDGLFTYSGSSKDTRYNTVYVSWSDPSRRYENSIEYVENTADVAKRGVISTDLIALGCTSRGQAYRAGKWLLYADQETVVFTVSVDNMRTKPGDVVEIYDKYRANISYSGRIVELRDTGVVLDRELQIDPNIAYTLRIVTNYSNTITQPDGSEEDTLTPKAQDFYITSNNVNGTLVTLNQTYSKNDFLNYTIWTLQEENLQPQLFKIISVQEKENDQYEINAIKFNNSKLGFIEENIPLTIPTFRKSDRLIKTIDDITVTEELQYMGNTVVNTANIYWGVNTSVNIIEFILEYTYRTNLEEDDNIWIYLGRVKDDNYTLIPAPQGYYKFKVSPVLYSGVVAKPTISDEIYLYGKSKKPGDVQNFTYIFTQDGLKFNWDTVSDLDLSHYILKNVDNGSSWEDSNNIVYNNIIDNTYTLLYYEYDRFLIKAVDTTGNESENYAEIDLSEILTDPELTNIKGTFTYTGYTLSWIANKGAFPISYVEIRENGETWGTSNYVDTLTSNRLNIFNFSTWEFPIQTYLLRVYDSSGRFTEYTFIQEVQNIELYNTTVNIYDTNVIVRWDINEPSFKYKNTKIYRSTTYYGDFNENDCTYLTTTYSHYYNTIENYGDTITYWLIPYDMANNSGNIEKISFNMDNNLNYEEFPITFTDSIHKNLVDILFNTYAIGPTDNTDETWAEHFVNRGYDTIADQIADNNLYYTIYDTGTICNNTFPCASTNSYYEEIFDLGTAYAALDEYYLSISVLTGEVIKENPEDQNAFVDIEVAISLSGSVFSSFEPLVLYNKDEERSIFYSYNVASDFRYIKIRFNFYSGNTSAGSVYKVTTAKLLLTQDNQIVTL